MESRDMSAKDAVQSVPAQSREIGCRPQVPSSCFHYIFLTNFPRGRARRTNRMRRQEGPQPRSVRHSPSTSPGTRRESATSTCSSNRSSPAAYTRPAILYSAARKIALCAAPANFSQPTATAALERLTRAAFLLARASPSRAAATISRTIQVPPKSRAAAFPAARASLIPPRFRLAATDSQKIHFQPTPPLHRLLPVAQGPSPGVPESQVRSEK